MDWLSPSYWSKAVADWFSSMGGNIASGIDAGFTSLFGDLWHYVEGPVYIALGILITFWVIMIYFRNDINAAVGKAAMAAVR